MSNVMTYANALAAAIRVAMHEDPRVFMAGEDIGIYGGAFGMSDGLLAEFGPERIIDTPISEDLAVGMGVGAAMMGQRPIIEIQFSDFILNAMDPVINQAAKLHFMYGGNVSVPLVVRGPAGGGTGAAAQHSQSLEALFAHIPGLKVVMPATGQDVHDLFLASLADPNPVIFFEHKLLYKTESEVTVRASIADSPAKLGEAAIVRPGTDVTVIAYSLMVSRALEAADVVAAEGINVQVVDLRTLRPLDEATIIDAVCATGRVVTVQEAPQAVSVGSELAALIALSRALDYLLAPIERIAGRDNPMPYAKQLEQATIPQVDDIVAGIRRAVKD